MTKLIVRIFEGKSRTPTLDHVFYGKNFTEAEAVSNAHMMTDRFYAAAINDGNYLGIPLTYTIEVSHATSKKRK